MRMKSYFSEMSTYKSVVLSLVLAVLTVVIAMFYGPLGVHNPFYVLTSFFSLQVFLLIATENFEGKRNQLVKQGLTFGSLKAVTAVLLVAFAFPPGNLLMGLMVAVAAGWLLISAGKDLLRAGSVFYDKILDQRAFSDEMKEVAHAARIEEALSYDLAEFLLSVDSPEEEKESE